MRETIKAIAACIEGDREELPALVERLSANHEVNELLLCLEVAKTCSPHRDINETRVYRGRARALELEARILKSLDAVNWKRGQAIIGEFNSLGFGFIAVRNALKRLTSDGRLEETTLKGKGSPRAYRIHTQECDS